VTPSPLDARSEHLLRELAPHVLGAVIRRFRDFTAAEDAVQEALVAAALQWPREGLPGNPRAWLIQGAVGETPFTVFSWERRRCNDRAGPLRPRAA
jgi:predicted RNA polymerase sigma factor